jgi:hypothetical protein
VALNLIEYATVGPDVVVIKFARTVKISSLVNANFIVETTDSTPLVVSNPFKTITTLNDYNQISRLLKLYWNTVLQGQKEYYIRVNGLVDASNQIIPEEKIKFTVEDAATPTSIATPKPPVIEQILVEDQSILAEPYTTYQIIAKNPDFYITSVEPENGDFYLENNYNDGRVIIYFNERPASNFLSSRFFKAQRKKIQRTPSRWENISANVSLHSWKPEVYVDFPSLGDATPSYFTDGKDYFESGYKYRIIVSENVGI